MLARGGGYTRTPLSTLAGTRREREDGEEHELMLQAMLRW